VAGLFWSRNGLNELADLATPDAFKQITRRHQRGTIGLAEQAGFLHSRSDLASALRTKASPRASVRGTGPKPAKETDIRSRTLKPYAHTPRRAGRRAKRPGEASGETRSQNRPAGRHSRRGGGQPKRIGQPS
jgi:hypothetical protein